MGDILGTYSGAFVVRIDQTVVTVLVVATIPSILVFLAEILSKNYFPGIFRCGVYPIITPVAMVLFMITVTGKHKLTQAQLRAAEKAKGLIRPGGDL